MTVSLRLWIVKNGLRKNNANSACSDNKRSIHFYFFRLQNQKRNWQTQPVATSANQTRRISIARIDFSSITGKNSKRDECFRNIVKIIFHRGIWFNPFRVLRRLRKYFANRIKECKRFVIRAISTRLLSFENSENIQNYDDSIPREDSRNEKLRRVFPSLSELHRRSSSTLVVSSSCRHYEITYRISNKWEN